jgi:Flp pilus assembly protein TadG
MIKKLKSFRQEDGIGVVWFALSFVVIAFIAGLAIDGGRLYLVKAQLRKAADAAVLSGGQELVNGNSTSAINDAVQVVVDQILTAHNEQNDLQDLQVKPNNEPKIILTLKRDVPLSFMAILGFKTAPVSVTSVAEIYPMGDSSGAVPFGIDERANFQKGVPYTLKVDAGYSDAGNFGILALAGVGGRLYEDALKYGYDQNLHPGEIVDTQTGNIQMKTINGVNYRISQSPYTTLDIANRDDPRIIKVLVYAPEQVSVNQLKSIRIKGFAYFYLLEPMSSTDSSVRGEFIDFVGNGKCDPNAADRGAYAIKLVR